MYPVLYFLRNVLSRPFSTTAGDVPPAAASFQPSASGFGAATPSPRSFTVLWEHYPVPG
jgi:hypothetical protein